MGRKVATLWHASFSIGAGVLFFYFVLPRWPELVGDTSDSLGTPLRIVTGALIGLAALPVVFILLRTRKPELGTPQLALSIRTWSIVAHVLAGVLIVGTAISEIWLKLDTAGQWLFAIYGAAAAIAVLGFFAFYLSFVAELPAPPPKPLKPKKPKERRGRVKKRADDDEADALPDAEDAEKPEGAEAEDDAETVEAKVDDAETAEADVDDAETAEADVDDAETAEADVDDAETAEAKTPEVPDVPEDDAAETAAAAAQPQPRLRNRRPTGKTSHRRRRTRGGVAVDE